MIPQEFEYFAPSTIEEAVGLLREHGEEAKMLARGHGLIPRMKRRVKAPAVLVDIGRIPELRDIERTNGIVYIDATTTHAQIEQATDLLDAVPLLPQAAGVVAADPLVRNLGTLSGSLADVEPAADWPAVALALAANLRVIGPDGERVIPIDDFFLGPTTTTLAPGELLVRIDVSVPSARAGMHYEKLVHPASGYAVVGIAAVVETDERNICRACRVAITGAGKRPARAKAIEDSLEGQTLTSHAIAQAAQKAGEGISFLDDPYASASYREQLVKVYTERALLAVVA